MKSSSHHRGYSLVELMVAIALLAMLGVGFAGIWTMGMRITQRMQRADDASWVLTQALSAVSALSRTALLALPSEEKETIQYGTNSFLITRTLRTIDDPADGMAPIDPEPADYFHVTVVATTGDKSIHETRTRDITPNP